MTNPHKLHGNNARIAPKRKVIPQFENYVINDYRTELYGNGRSYHRLDDDADFAKDEVDANEK